MLNGNFPQFLIMYLIGKFVVVVIVIVVVFGVLVSQIICFKKTEGFNIII